MRKKKFIFDFCAGGRCLHLVWMAAASPFSLSDRCAWCCDGQVRNLYPTRFSLSLFRFFSAGLIRDSHRLRHTPQDWPIKSITFHLLPLYLLFFHFLYILVKKSTAHLLPRTINEIIFIKMSTIFTSIDRPFKALHFFFWPDLIIFINNNFNELFPVLSSWFPWKPVF